MIRIFSEHAFHLHDDIHIENRVDVFPSICCVDRGGTTADSTLCRNSGVACDDAGRLGSLGLSWKVRL